MFAKEIEALKKEVKELRELVDFLLEKHFEQNPPEDEE